jgi:putative YphP/YqiW family bacilliredoxin
MYPAEIVLPMKAELTNNGFTELLSPEDVQSSIQSPGTTLLFINSVCGCSASTARPGVIAASKTEHKPTKLTTVFAGFDIDSTKEARKFMLPYPPSSPCIALFKDGALVHFVERHHIEGRSSDQISNNLINAFEKYCN